MNFYERINSHEWYLNDTDDDIAEYILKNKEVISKLSVQKIASDLYISPNSIMRFAKKIGYSGFSELKFDIQNEGKSESKTLSRQVMDKLPINISKTLDAIDENVLKTVATMMHKANCCIFAGVGDSIYFCETLGKNLRCTDRNVQYYQHIHDMFYAISHATDKDILIVISASGENERLCKLVDNAKEKNIKTISITHFYENSLSSVCDINLYFWGEHREVQGYNVTDRTGLMVLIRLLSEEFWRNF